MARAAVALLVASATVALSGCAGIRPVLAIDDQGADIGLHADWRELGAGLASIFCRQKDEGSKDPKWAAIEQKLGSRRAKAAGLPDFCLPHEDAPAQPKPSAISQSLDSLPHEDAPADGKALRTPATR